MPELIIKISELNELLEIADDDWLVVVDVDEPIEAEQTKKIKKENISAPILEILDAVYPVGSIYIATVATNPATLFGFGTWAAFGAGRTIVGLDAGQTEFDTVEETGGAKTHTLLTAEMPSHTHTQNPHNHTVDFNDLWRWQAWTSGSSAYGFRYDGALPTSSETAVNQNTGGGGAHNNLQPYIVVYMWKRTE